MEDFSSVLHPEGTEDYQVLMLKGSHIFFAENGNFALGQKICLLQLLSEQTVEVSHFTLVS